MVGFSASQVEAIQASGYKAVLAVAGGGTGAVHTLLSHPGASRFVFEAQVPYSPEAMFDFLGEALSQHCSKEAARTMAGRAYERALVFNLAASRRAPILGIACTAALRTTRDRRGADRAYACIKAHDTIMERELNVPDGNRTEQEEDVSRALLEMILQFVERNAA